MTDFSIVTVCKNSASTIADTVFSVLEQRNVTVEHVIKDGGSADRTLEIVVGLNPGAKVIESTDAGIYEAMNQGFSKCQGDIIGFLNSDDYYNDPNILSTVLEVFNTKECDIVYGDIEFINNNGKVVRIWKSRAIRDGSLNGKQLPHPAFFVRRSTLDKLDIPFDPSYRISADLKQQLILIEKLGLKAEYLPRILVKMRIGGQSTRTLRNVVAGWVECARAYREVHERSGWLFVARKVSSKLSQVKFSRTT